MVPEGKWVCQRDKDFGEESLRSGNRGFEHRPDCPGKPRGALERPIICLWGTRIFARELRFRPRSNDGMDAHIDRRQKIRRPRATIPQAQAGRPSRQLDAGVCDRGTKERRGSFARLNSANQKDDQSYDEDRSKNAATDVHKFLQCLP